MPSEAKYRQLMTAKIYFGAEIRDGRVASPGFKASDARLTQRIHVHPTADCHYGLLLIAASAARCFMAAGQRRAFLHFIITCQEGGRFQSLVATVTSSKARPVAGRGGLLRLSLSRRLVESQRLQ